MVFAAEVTGGFGLLLPLLLAMAIAEIVVERGLDERVMTDKLFRRGFRVDFDMQTDPLRMRTVAAVMDPIPEDQVAPEARGRREEADDAVLRSTGASARASQGADVAPTAPARPDPAVDRWAFLAEALPFLLRSNCARVAVTDHGEVVGYVTREQVDAELRRRAAEEDVQPPTLRLRRPRLPTIPRRTRVAACVDAGRGPAGEEDGPAC